MQEKIFELIKETATNEYFLYSIIIITILTIIKSLKDYKLYKYDCIVLNQKPKPIGFGINTLVNIIGLIIISNIAFTGYTIYKHKEIFNNDKLYTLENIELAKESKNIKPTYKIEKRIVHNKPAIKHNPHEIIIKHQQKEKSIIRKLSAKEKLKKELEQAIKDVN